MAPKVFRELLEVMKSRGGPYPGLDIPEFFALVEELFDPEEAEINNALSRKPTPVSEVAAKAGRSPKNVSEILERMAASGIVRRDNHHADLRLAVRNQQVAKNGLSHANLLSGYPQVLT